MAISSDFDVEIRRNRSVIRSWVERLRELGEGYEDLDLRAAAWIRRLPSEKLLRLESEVARLDSEQDDLEAISSGPIGELCRRFRGPDDGLIDLEAEEPDETFFDDEIVDLEHRRMEDADVVWFAGWREFEDSLEKSEFLLD